MQRAERLMKLLELLHEKPGLDAAALSDACGVSGRTVQRDLDALNQAGFAVYFDRGYRLAAPALLPPVTFAINEALALRLAAENAAMRADAATARTLGLAARKLGGALAARPPEESSSPQLSLGLPIRDERTEESLRVLTRAIGERRTIRIRLKTRAGQESVTRRVDPYRLAQTDAGWEVLAYNHERERMMHFPLARIATVSVLQRRFEPLPVRILERHLHAYQTAAPRVQWVRLRCRPPFAETVKECPPLGTVDQETLPDGSVALTLATMRPKDLLPWLLASGDVVEVLQPSSLRQELHRVARTLSERYATQIAGQETGAPRAAGPPVSLS